MTHTLFVNAYEITTNNQQYLSNYLKEAFKLQPKEIESLFTHKIFNDYYGNRTYEVVAV